MTTVDTDITTPQGVLDAARRLAPSIAARADEIEAGRRVPRDLLDELIAARVFRVLRPATHGGIGADLPGAMRVYEALARADASVGWTVMIGSGSWCDLASLPRATFDELFSDAPDVITAGVFSPTGSIAADDDGYRVTGRWSFASGCEHADWIYGNCVEAVVDGVPQLRIAVFSPDQVVIEDTWTVSGLCGTGSHHFHVDSVVVPVERTLDPMADAPSLDAPILRVPIPGSSRSPSRASRSAARRARWTTSSQSPRTRCPSSTAGPSPPTRPSSSSWPPPTPSSARPGR